MDYTRNDNFLQNIKENCIRNYKIIIIIIMLLLHLIIEITRK